MNFQFYLEKLHVSEKYKDFIKENPEAYFCSGFFEIENEKITKQHFDYCVGDEMFSFQIEAGCEKVPVNTFGAKAPDTLEGTRKNEDSINFNFKEIEKLILDKIREEGVDKKVQKILLSLQSINGKSFLLGTIFISMMGLLKVQIDLEKKEIVDFEKKSFMDIMKVIKKD